MSMTMSLLNRLSKIKTELGLTEPEFILLLSICELGWTVKNQRKKLIKNHPPYEKSLSGLLKNSKPRILKACSL